MILNFCQIVNNIEISKGNWLSPTILNIVLDKLLDKTKTKFKGLNIDIKFLFNYVDIFAVVRSNRRNTGTAVKLQQTLDICIPFFNMKIFREEDRGVANEYTKPTSCDRLINFNSNLSQHQNVNTTRNIIINAGHQKFH